MTSLVSRSTESVFDSGTLESLSTSFGVVLVALLIVLLVEQQLMRAFNRSGRSSAARSLSVASIPMLLTAAAVFAARFAELLK
jgi:hypothetical protein